MSVGLGTLRTVGNDKSRQVDVIATNYDADELRLEAGAWDAGGVFMELTLDRKQLQELSIIIDRFLDD